MNRKILKLNRSILTFLILLAIVVAANVILSAFNLRFDLTEENLYTLSDGTQQVLDDLKQPVTLKFFFTESYAQVPTGIRNYARRVEDLLAEYEIAADGEIAVEKFDPVPDSNAEDWARRYGVQGQSAGLMGPEIYLGLVAVSGENEEVLPALDPAKEDSLEYDITRMITRVESRRKATVGIVSSLPVLGSSSPQRNPFQQRMRQPAWFAFQNLEKDYNVENISPPFEKIDAGIDALVLVHPKQLPEESLYAIDQFLLGGGKILALLDPKNMVEAQSQQNPQMTMMGGEPSDLGGLLDAWGVAFDNGKVVADLKAASQLRSGGNQIVESPVWLSLDSENMNSEDILTAGLESIMMPLAGSFQVEADADLDTTTLIASSKTSDMIDAMAAGMSPAAVRDSFESEGEALDLAVRISGRFKSAFPDGPPEANENGEQEEEDVQDMSDQQEDQSEQGDETDKKAAEQAETSKGLAESAQEGVVVLVGDADLIYDQFCLRQMDMFGASGYQMLNDNIAFFENIVEQITGSTRLIGIRTRGKTERPFEIVQELLRKAQERYLREEQKLQAKLQKAQQRLQQLQTRKQEGQQLVLSPEQKQEIEKYRQQEYETRKQLKLVRRKLRKDIERLGAKIKAVNILLMPALVTIAGIGFGIYRKRRQ